jgi:hypothetical protein
MSNMKTLGQRILKLVGGQAFFSKSPFVLDIWPGDLKINIGHLIIMTNLNAIYEDYGSKDS